MIRSTVSALVAHAEVDVSCYSVTWRERGRLPDVCPAGAMTHARPFPARAAHRLWLRAPVPWAELLSGPTNVVHGMNYVVPPTRKAAAVVSVHDLTFAHFPEWVTEPVRRFPALIQKAIDRGAWVHTGAEAIADEIRDYFDVEPDRVVAIHHGLDHTLSPGGADPSIQPQPRNYVLALGTIEPRKDHAGLVNAFDLLAQSHPELRLVIAGSRGWGTDAFDQALAQSRHRDRIDVLGYVGEAERQSLLRNAAVLAYPSRYEGFGLPPLEAMQVDVPVVTTDAGSLPEVVGNAAQIAACGDTTSLAEAIEQALEPKRARELISAGRANLERFDWSETAERLVELYQKAAQGGR